MVLSSSLSVHKVMEPHHTRSLLIFTNSAQMTPQPISHVSITQMSNEMNQDIKQNGTISFGTKNNNAVKQIDELFDSTLEEDIHY